MDFDLHFGRFFGPKIDVFEKFLLPDFELQLEIRSAKIVILPRENAVFYKIDILALKWALMENMKKTAKNRFEINSFFHIDFSWILEPTWMGFGLQIGPQKTDRNCLFCKLRPRGVQEAPKWLQERPKGVSRASNSLPRGLQECPRAIKTCPGHAQGASQGSLFEDFLVFQCFSAFFCVFLRFSVFFCVFSVFFYSVPPLTFPPCRAS